MYADRFDQQHKHMGQSVGVWKKRYASLFENSPLCIHEIERDGHVVTMNPAGLRLLELPDVNAVIGAPYLDLVLDGDLEKVRELMQRAYQGKTVKYVFTAINGMSFQSIFIPIKDDDDTITGLIGLSQHISGDKGVADAFAELQDQNELILHSAGEGIYGLDAQGRITFGNAAAAAIVGWQTGKVLGQKAHDVHHHSYPDGSSYPREDCPIYAALKDGEVHHVDNEVFWHADGSAVPVEYTSTPVLKDGKL